MPCHAAPRRSPPRPRAVLTARRRRPLTLSARTAVYVLPAVLSHFGPSLGMMAIDNVFGMMQGVGGLLLVQLKVLWMTQTSKYAGAVGAAVGLFFGWRLDALARRVGATRVPPSPAKAWRWQRPDAAGRARSTVRRPRPSSCCSTSSSAAARRRLYI